MGRCPRSSHAQASLVPSTASSSRTGIGRTLARRRVARRAYLAYCVVPPAPGAGAGAVVAGTGGGAGASTPLPTQPKA